MEENINQLVTDFARLDAEQKRLKKQSDPLKDEIKDFMYNNNINKISEGPVSASFRVQERTKLNEDRLVMKLKSLGLTQAIKTVEVPDQKIVEELIYTGTLNPAELDDCVSTTYVQVLSVRGGDKLE